MIDFIHKKRAEILLSVLIIIGMEGCTTLVTAPIDIAGSVVGATFTMAGAATSAVIDAVSDDDKDNKD